MNTQKSMDGGAQRAHQAETPADVAGEAERDTDLDPRSAAREIPIRRAPRRPAPVDTTPGGIAERELLHEGQDIDLGEALEDRPSHADQHDAQNGNDYPFGKDMREGRQSDAPQRSLHY